MSLVAASIVLAAALAAVAVAIPPIPPLIYPPRPHTVLVYQSEAPRLDGRPVVVRHSRLVRIGHDRYIVPRQTIQQVRALREALSLRLSRIEDRSATLYAPDRFDRQLAWPRPGARERARYVPSRYVRVSGNRWCWSKRECRKARGGWPGALRDLLEGMDALVRRLERSRR